MASAMTKNRIQSDILEWHVPEEVLAVLLKDRSTGRNLIWATDDYTARGKGFDALSNQLQVELPGLRGFSAMSIRYMRLFFEAWSPCAEIQHLASVGFGGVAFQHLSSVESHYLTSNEFGSTQNRQLPTAEIRPMPLGDLDKDDIAAFFSIGLLLCEEMKKPVVQLAVQDISKPIGVATYKTLRSIPQPYKTLAPVIEGVRRVMANARAESDLKSKKKSTPRKTAKGGKR